MLRYKIVNIVFLGLLIIHSVLNWFHYVRPWTIILLLIAYWLVRLYGSFVISSQFFVSVRCNGPTRSDAISITFDDGPLPGKTDRILNILRSHGVPAAFFCIGKRLVKEPELVKQIHADGHIIGNHSFTHSTLFDLHSRTAMDHELRSTDQELTKIIGLKPRFFRPPYGIINPNLARAIALGGYVTVGWNIRSLDTVTKNRAKLLRRVTKNLKAGDIVLFHDYCDSTIEILPEFLGHVSSLGLKVVRVDQLLNEQPYV